MSDMIAVVGEMPIPNAQRFIETLTNRNAFNGFYCFELEPTITTTKRGSPHNVRNFVANNDIVVGIFSTNTANLRLEIGGSDVLTMQTNGDKFTYLFDDTNFVYPKMLKYHDIKMDVDKKHFLQFNTPP